MKLKKLNLKDLEKIVKYAEGEPKDANCLDIKGLQSYLNLCISISNDMIKEDKRLTTKPRIKAEIKSLKEGENRFNEYFQEKKRAFYEAYAYIEHDKESLIKKGLSEFHIETALIVILLELQVREEWTNRSLELVNKNLNGLPTTPQTSPEKLFLYDSLPRAFDKYFDIKFGREQSEITLPTGVVKNVFIGPGIRFIQAISKYMGDEKTPDAIITRWRESTHYKSRLKKIIGQKSISSP